MGIAEQAERSFLRSARISFDVLIKKSTCLMYLWYMCNSHLICVCMCACVRVHTHWYRYVYTLLLSKLQAGLPYQPFTSFAIFLILFFNQNKLRCLPVTPIPWFLFYLQQLFRSPVSSVVRQSLSS